MYSPLRFAHLRRVSKSRWRLINDLRGGCTFASHLRDSLRAPRLPTTVAADTRCVIG